FVDMSPGKDQEYFCDGIAEELINALTQVKDLRVVARTSAFQFREKGYDIHEVGEKLKVQTVLEGSVRKAGNRLRITAQLVNVVDGYHLWSERFDREMDDIFAIQDEITMAIVRRLRPTLLGEEKARIVKRQTIDFEAYNLCLKGRYFWNRQTAKALEKAIRYYSEAIETDPGCALAYTGLADCYIQLPFYSISPPNEVYPRAREAVLNALENDDKLAEAHVSAAYMKTIYEWDWEYAEREFKRAIELNPGYATAHHWYAYHLFFMARFDEAIAEMRRALELDPLSLIINREVGLVFTYARRYDEAIEALEKTIEMDPGFVGTHYLLGIAYLQKSMHEEAIRAFEREKELPISFDPHREGWIGARYGAMGKIDEAKKTLNALLGRLKQEYVSPFILGVMYLVIGESDEGFEWLDKAYEEKDPWLCFLKIEPTLDSVRSDPRYNTLLKKIRLDT
ncbi:MAG: tetratricopeptide repeat protein, partial [Candidatus Hydrogenedentota bacterium]